MAHEPGAYAYAEAVIPHRDEMLYVGRIENLHRKSQEDSIDSTDEVDLRPGEIERVQTIWWPQVAAGGVVRKIKAVEAMAQAGCIGVLYDQKVGSDDSSQNSGSEIVPLFAGIPRANFVGRAWQGDTVSIDVSIDGKSTRDFTGRGIAINSTHNHEIADAVIAGKMIPPEMAERLFGSLVPVLADPEAKKHKKKIPLPADFFERDPKETWLDGVTEESTYDGEGFWLPDEYQYQGHFPGRPVLPGIKQVGSMEDLSLIVLRDEDPDAELVGLQNVVFKRPIQPGERADVSVDLVELESIDGNVRYVSFGTVRVEGAIACKGALFFGTVAA